MARQVPCPYCKQPAEWSPTNPWRPFCSERCKQIDLGHWAAEDYRIPAEPVPSSDTPESLN